MPLLYNSNLGNASSIIGLVVSLIGFFVTIIGVFRSKTAAEQAREAAKTASKEIHRFKTISDISSVLTLMEEIKRLHRDNKWHALPDKYSHLRASLIHIKKDSFCFEKADLSIIQSSKMQLTILEEEVDIHLSNNNKPIDIPKVNKIINEHLVGLHEILANTMNKGSIHG